MKRLGFLAFVLGALLAGPAAAQQCRIDPNAGALTLTAGTMEPLRCLANGQLATNAAGGGGGGDATAVNQVTGNGFLSDIIAKLPTVGTAGTASANVLTIQGIAGGTVVPISGTVTANIGTGGVVGYNAGDAVTGANGLQTGGVDTSGNFLRTPATATYTVTAASATNLVLKASAGRLLDVSAYCSAACYLFVVNATSAPGDGAVTPMIPPVAIPAGGTGSVSFGSIHVPFATGATAFVSTVGGYTKTTPGAGVYVIGGRTL